MFRYSEIVSLFHTPTIVKVLGMVGLSFSLLMCVQQMQLKTFIDGKNRARQRKQCYYFTLLIYVSVMLFKPSPAVS